MLTQLQSNKTKVYIFIVILCLTLNSCGLGILFQVRYDFDIAQDEIIEFGETNEIPMDELYLLSEDYPNLLIDLAQQANLAKDTMKNFMQPLQVICYDYSDSIVGFIPNCLVRGNFLSTSLKWNKENVFDEFPILTPRFIISEADSSYIIDSRPVTIPSDSIISYLNPIIDKEKVIKKQNIEEYKVFVFCGLMLENYSEDLIGEVKKSIEIGNKEGKTISVYYVMTDGLYDYQISQLQNHN